MLLKYMRIFVFLVAVAVTSACGHLQDVLGAEKAAGEILRANCQDMETDKVSQRSELSRQFHKFEDKLKNCQQFKRDDKHYLDKLGLCGCLLADRRHELVWLASASYPLDKLVATIEQSLQQSDKTRASGRLGGSLIDVAYGKYADGAATPDFMLKSVYEQVARSAADYRRDPWQSPLGFTFAFNSNNSNDAPKQYVRQICKPLLADKHLESIWNIVRHLKELTGADYYSRNLLLASDGQLTSLLIQRGFCATAVNLLNQYFAKDWLKKN